MISTEIGAVTPRSSSSAQKADEIELALTGQPPTVAGVLHLVALRRAGVVQLDQDHPLGRDGLELAGIRRAPEIVPGVDLDAAVGPTGSSSDLPRRPGVGYSAPWQKFDTRQQAVVGGPVADSGEAFDDLVERQHGTGRTDIAAVDMAGSDEIGQGEERRFLLRASRSRDHPRWPSPKETRASATATPWWSRMALMSASVRPAARSAP